MLVLIAILCGICAATSLIALVSALLFYLNARSLVSRFLEPSGKDGSSQFALLVDSMSQILAGRVAAAALAALRGSAGGSLGNLANKATQEVADQAFADSPALAAVQALFPKLGKNLARNPAGMLALSRVLSNMGLSGTQPQKDGNDGQGSQSKLNLGI